MKDGRGKVMNVVKLLQEGKVETSDNTTGANGTLTTSTETKNDGEEASATSLISLPVHDVQPTQSLIPSNKKSGTQGTQKISSKDDGKHKDASSDDVPPPPFVLMELPSLAMLKDMIRSRNTYIVGPRSSHGRSKSVQHVPKNNDESDCGSSSDDDSEEEDMNPTLPKKTALLKRLEEELQRRSQARLVLEENREENPHEEGAKGNHSVRGQSYAINKVDTSNTLVVISPQQESSTTTNLPTSTKENEHDVSQNREALKCNNKKEQRQEPDVKLTGRLVMPSMYLELLPKPLVHLPYLKELLLRDAKLRRHRIQQNLYSGRYDQDLTSSTTDSPSPHKKKRRRMMDDVENTTVDKKKRGRGKGHGWTLSRLARKVQCSQAQTLQALEKLRAYSWSYDDQENPTSSSCATMQSNMCFSMLTEEIEDEVMTNILSALTEHPELMIEAEKAESADNNKPGDIHLEYDGCLALVRKLLIGNNDDPVMTDEHIIEIKYELGGFRSIIRHCLDALLCESVTAGTAGAKQLDMNKVAKEVAKQMFITTSSNLPSWMTALSEFQSEWMRRMPGLSCTEAPSLELLKGVAILGESTEGGASTTNGEGKTNEKELQSENGGNFEKTATPSGYDNPYLKKGQNSSQGASPCLIYLPESHMPLDCEERFRALFRCRKEWTQNELEPYLEPLLHTGALPSQVSDVPGLLTLHTRAVGDENTTGSSTGGDRGSKLTQMRYQEKTPAL